VVKQMDTTIDPVRQLVRLALSERRLKMSDVSKSLGKNHAYLHQFLDRGIPARCRRKSARGLRKYSKFQRHS
jgi:hypothetical protein